MSTTIMSLPHYYVHYIPTPLLCPLYPYPATMSTMSTILTINLYRYFDVMLKV